MGNESGTWIMYGVDWDDPECIHTVDEAIESINKVGFLPLFKNEIPGFSLEERTVPEYWWCEDPKMDPWMWREIIARSGKVAYGKFFDKKAGFISVEWLPVFANYRRDGYDFDALYEDGKARRKHKKIMDNFIEDKVDSEILSNQLKVMAGFGKDGEKGFDGAVTTLMMQLYLCNTDFRKRKNKKGQEYGWNVAAYCAPEHLWGYDTVTALYKEDPKASWERIVEHIGNVHKYAREEDRPEKILFIITTDGMENSSHQYSCGKVKKMVERQKKKYGWEFLFLGANIDAIEVAGRFGIAANRAINYECDSKGTQLNYEVLSRTVSEFRAYECDDEADMDEMFEACCAPIMEDYKKRHRA